MPIIIKEVELENDLPFLAEINRRTFLQELPSQFAYKPEKDNGNQLVGFFKDRLVGRLGQPNARMFKALDQDTNQIYGFACWRHVGKPDDAAAAVAAPAPTAAKTAAAAAPQLPPFMNAEFTVATGAEVKQLEDHMTGEYYCTSPPITSISSPPSFPPPPDESICQL